MFRFYSLECGFQFLVLRKIRTDGNHRSRTDIVVNPLRVSYRQADAAMAGTVPQHFIAAFLDGLYAYGAVNRRMERHGSIDPRPVTCVIAPLREITPAGLPAVQHPVAHRAVCSDLAGGAEHLADRNRIVPFLVPGIHGNNLVGNVDRDSERRGFLCRFRLRSRVRHHDTRVIESKGH